MMVESDKNARGKGRRNLRRILAGCIMQGTRGERPADRVGIKMLHCRALCPYLMDEVVVDTSLQAKQHLSLRISC